MLTEIYRKYAGCMFRAAMKVLGNREDAEDAVHQVFLWLLEHKAALDGREDDAVKAYLLLAAEHRAYDILRRKKRISGDDPEEMPADIPETEGESFAGSALAEAIQKLPVKERSFILLHFVWGYDYREIGAAYGMGGGAVQRAVSRARKKLEKLLAEGEG